MNESTVSSKFQSDLRKTLPGCEVIKHADKSMIGMVDASVTHNKVTVWLEYKFICPTTKGVVASEFNRVGVWSPLAVAQASPTQFDMAKRLARAGHCFYIFWVLDHENLRKRVGYVVLWHPITGDYFRMGPAELISTIEGVLTTPLVASSNKQSVTDV